MAFYIFFFGLISILKYNSFSYDDFDLAIQAQPLYNILHGSIQSSILGVPFLGNHLQLILFLIAPIYAIFRSPVTLLLLQTVALGLSGYPIYLIAKEQLPRRFSLILLFSYLFYPSLGYVNLFEFHPTAFATLFISLALYCIYKNKIGPFFMFVMLSLLCQENTSLVILAIGIYLLIIRKPFKWWFITIVIGGIWFWVAVYKLIPYFGKGTISFISIYGHLGSSIGDVLKNILIHPIQVLGIILMKENLAYLMQIFGPVSFLPILSPVAFLGALPTLFQHLLSLRQKEHMIFYHYTAEIIPFIFFSSIFAVKKILAIKPLHKKENFLAGCFLIVAIGSNLILGPHVESLLNMKRFFKTEVSGAKKAFLENIPKGAEVVATFEFLPKLSNRKNLYSLHHVVMGYYTLSDMPYELPKTTEYAIVNFEDSITFKNTLYDKQSGQRLRSLFLDDNFGIDNMLDTIVLFKKGLKSNYFLYRILPGEPPLLSKLSTVVNGEIELIGCDIDKSEIKKGIISFKFYWRCLKNPDRTYGVFLDVVDDSDRVIKRGTRFICYRVYPTDEWGQGQVIEEFYRLLLPFSLSEHDYQVKMSIFDFGTNAIQNIKSNVKNAIDDKMRVNLIRFKEE